MGLDGCARKVSLELSTREQHRTAPNHVIIWRACAGGVKGAKPYAKQGDARSYPLPGWSTNTSAAANKISAWWRDALQGADVNTTAAYNVTLNTLAGQAHAPTILRALNIVFAANARQPQTLSEATAEYESDNGCVAIIVSPFSVPRFTVGRFTMCAQADA